MYVGTAAGKAGFTAYRVRLHNGRRFLPGIAPVGGFGYKELGIYGIANHNAVFVIVKMYWPGTLTTGLYWF